MIGFIGFSPTGTRRTHGHLEKSFVSTWEHSALCSFAEARPKIEEAIKLQHLVSNTDEGLQLMRLQTCSPNRCARRHQLTSSFPNYYKRGDTRSDISPTFIFYLYPEMQQEEPAVSPPCSPCIPPEGGDIIPQHPNFLTPLLNETTLGNKLYSNILRVQQNSFTPFYSLAAGAVSSARSTE